jgi:3D (Asp-Asp-Asp) domain-containing protein
MVDLTELQDLVNKLQDQSLLKRVASNSLHNMVEAQASFTVKNTKFKNSKGVTLAAIDTSVTGLTGEVFIEQRKVPYINYINDGTGIYGPKKKVIVIEPKNKLALSWASGDSRFFSNGHTSNGQRPNPFMLDAYKKNEKKLFKDYEEDMVDQLQDAIR